MFAIAEQLNQHEFCDLVLPALKPVFEVRDPPQNMIVLLEKLDVLQQKTPRETFRDDIMPLVYAALEAPTALVQEKALRIVPSLAESLDYTTVKNAVFPRVQALFHTTTVLSVKVSTLICFHAMIKVIDKVRTKNIYLYFFFQWINPNFKVHNARKTCSCIKAYQDKRTCSDGNVLYTTMALPSYV